MCDCCTNAAAALIDSSLVVVVVARLGSARFDSAGLDLVVIFHSPLVAVADTLGSVVFLFD